MPRIDDYRNAASLSKNDLKGKDPARLASAGGAEIQTGGGGKTILKLKFLGREVVLTWPELDFSYRDSGEEVPIQQQVLLLHYLNGSTESQPSGEWIAYQEVPDGRFYLDAFLRRAKVPMVQAFGSDPEKLVELATELYGAKPFDQGDVSVVVQALPKVPVGLILWKGDEEFPPEGNLLFDKSIARILSAEDIAWLSGMIIYPLIGMSKK